MVDFLFLPGKVLFYVIFVSFPSLFLFSAQFLQLSAPPNVMDIQVDKKGLFPHFFNRKDTQNYIGELPTVEE